MRNLTIRRNKTFVACLGKMKVYIEDHASSEITIGGIPCRKLGDLKNGEEKTFEVTEEAARIYVIADKLSKNYCSECYDLAPGTEDVFLSGQNRYNPVTGNAFRFDGVASEASKQHRQKGLVIGIVVLCVAFFIGMVIGFGGVVLDAILDRSSPETFSENGIEITLTGEFMSLDMDEFTACFGSPDVAIYALEESYGLWEGAEELSVKEYGELVIDANTLAASDIKTKDGLTYFTYSSSASGDTYQYYAFLYKADDAFWMVQFAVLKEDAAEYTEEIFEWAGSVRFP